MARLVSWGTPKRTQRIVQPRRPALVRVSLAAGALLLVGAGVGEITGFRDPLSPGSLSHSHAAYASRCQVCHVPMQGAVDGRCESCHDTAATGRLTRSAHAGRRGTEPRDPSSRECTGCHAEHRGADRALAGVGEERCQACHGDASRVETAVATFADHPEFRVLAAGELPSSGIRFSHLNHVTGDESLAPYLGGDTCARCHQLDPAGADFLPLSFEATCAGCHGGDLQMSPAPVNAVARLDEMAASVGAARIRAWRLGEDEFEERDGRILKVEIGHRDPWVLFNLKRLRVALDPAGAAAQRHDLEARAAELERRLAADRAVAKLLEDVPGPMQDLLATRRETLNEATQEIRDELAQLDGLRAESSERPVPVEPMRDALGALTGDCALCHEISALGLLAPVAAARPVLERGRFSHRDHVSQGEDCTSCHAGDDGESWWIETSHDSSRLSFRGVASCRECHDAAVARDRCQTCHTYHPGDPS